MVDCHKESTEVSGNIDVHVQRLKDDIHKKAEHVIFNILPAKILELNEAIEGSMFNIEDLSVLHTSSKLSISSLCNGLPDNNTATSPVKPGSKRQRVDGLDDLVVAKKCPAVVVTAPIPPNPRIVSIVDYLKPQIISIINSCGKIKLWIQLMIPKIEDGNNFGVSIQEDILAEVTKAESDSTAYLDQMTKYFTSRGVMVAKIAKYPQLGDFQRGLDEYDEKVYFSFKLILTEIRNICVVLYDVIFKNYTKLKQPRGVNTTSLY